MANTQKLISWLIDNSTQLKLQVTELTWVRDCGLSGVFDFQVSIELGGKIFIGRGTATTEELAFVKAGAEAIERAFCGGLEISTLGVAVHTSEKLAKENAIQELIERDAFFCHYYSKTPFLKLSSAVVSEFESKWPVAFEKMRANKVDCQFHKLNSEVDFVVICIFSGKNSNPVFGGVVGLGANHNQQEAMQSAFFEGLRNVEVCLHSKNLVVLSEYDFSKIEKPQSIDRQRLAQNLDYWKKFEYLFDTPSEALTILSQKNQKPILCEKLLSPFAELNDAPVFVCRAEFEKSGEALLRPWDKSPTTLTGLQKFTGINLTDADLETKPHFLG